MSLNNYIGPLDTPIVSNDHPETAFEAAERVINSGRRETTTKRILRRLLQGSVWNTEMAHIIGFRARLTDLRHLGFDVQCVKQQDNGKALYKLIGYDPTADFCKMGNKKSETNTELSMTVIKLENEIKLLKKQIADFIYIATKYPTIDKFIKARGFFNKV